MPSTGKKTRRYWPLVVLGLIPVLILVWFQADGDDPETGGDAYVLERLAEDWPTPELDEDGSDIVFEAMGHACDDPDQCHVLWADYEASPAGVPEAAIILADVDEDGELRRWDVTWREDREDDDGFVVSDPRPLQREVPTLTISPVMAEEGETWLFPPEAEDVEELRYDPDEEEVVARELEQPDGAAFERVRTQGAEGSANTSPILRYTTSSGGVYRIRGDMRACVKDLSRWCDLPFPSEEALVSLRTVWERHSEYRWGFEADWAHGPDYSGSLDTDESVEMDPDFGGLAADPVTNETGHVAQVEWFRERGTDLEDLTRLVTHAVYFDDGAPAVLSAYHDPSRETAPFPEPKKTPDGVTGIALFPGVVDDEHEELLPVAFHPSGNQPLLAPELEEEDGDSGFTVYEPVPTGGFQPISYAHRNEDGDPLVSGWLENDSIRP